jgi:ribose/xylose/arabinose/galactoside ABC-type transport system permease subunit
MTNTTEPDFTPSTTVNVSRFVRLLRSLGPLLALAIVVLGFAIADKIVGQGRFSEMRNVRVVLVLTAPVAVAALGMTLVIIAGGIDLSAGTAAMLCTTVLACSLNQGHSVTLAVLLTLGVGATCGLTNGLLIGILRIPPFIVTLGTMTIFLGIAKRLAQWVADHATPVGSGTVARTKRIPVEQRAEAAVIAWMRHQTTGYDSMVIPRVKGKRREVRRMLAQRSKELLARYRKGETIDANCPLALALAKPRS